MQASEYISKILATGKVKDHLPATRQAVLDLYYLLTIHLQGIKPRYKNLRLYSDAYSGTDNLYVETGGTRRNIGMWITPTGWQPKFQPYFENEILNRYPTMREERFHWQCSIYPKFPQSLFLQAIDEVRGAIFQDGNYDYLCANESTQTYIAQKQFSGLDFYDYVTDMLLFQVINDPNGYTAVIPNDFYEIEPDEDAGQPELIYVCCEDIFYQSDDLLAFNYEGKGCMIIDEENYYFIPFDRKEKKYLLSQTIVLPHTLDAAPFRQHGGYRMHSKDTGCYYLSYFAGAVDWANIAVRDFLDVQAAKKDLIPITQQIDIECNTCHGVGSIPVLCEDGSAGCSQPCTYCNGRGAISRNMGDVITVDRQDIIDGKMPDYVRYISADVASLEAMSKEFEQLYKRFQEALYLRFSDLAQSGVAKEMDREKMYKFLQSFSTNIFNIVFDLLTYIDGLLNNTEANGELITIRRPSQFKLKTESDLRDELRQLQTAGVDELVIKSVSDTLTMVANESPVTEKVIQVLSLYDPLRYKTDQQKTNLTIVAGAYSKADLIRSARAANEIQRLIYKMGEDWFLAASYEQIAAALDTALEPYINEATQIPQTGM